MIYHFYFCPRIVVQILKSQSCVVNQEGRFHINCAKYFRFASRPFYVTCSRQPSEKKIQCKILSSLLKDSIWDFAQPSVWTWGPHFKIKWNKQIHTIEVLIQSFFYSFQFQRDVYVAMILHFKPSCIAVNIEVLRGYVSQFSPALCKTWNLIH